MTYLVERCPCCASADHVAFPAIVSPFVASYALGVTPPPTRLCECRECGFRYFEDRLTDDENQKLYSGYRGDRYYEARHRFEPWYTRKVNDGIGGDDELVRTRKNLVASFIADHIDVAAIDDVLDFGGDRGQLIPEIGKKKFVFEISGVEPVEGVTCIANQADLEGRTFDLVLSSHVLEHCSEPLDVLASLRPLLRSNTSALYIELPFERASLRWLSRSEAYGKYLSALRHTGPLLTAVDFYSTAARLKLNAVPPLGFVKMHEHVNFFDERSLGRLLERAGFSPIAIERQVIRSTLGETPILSAVARPAQST